MNLIRSFTAAFIACVFTALAFAADASPAGTWKWSVGAQGAEQTLKLNYANGTLSGTLVGTKVGNTEFPDTPISDASFVNGVVKFSVTREAGGMKATTRYEGTLQGDAIQGSRDVPDLKGGGPATKREWVAHRAK